MPVEIKELVIRAVVDHGRPARGLMEDVAEQAEHIDQKKLLETCVREVLRVLKKAEER